MDSIKRYYTGCGSRQTPKKILDIMTRIAQKMSKTGLILRSGAAEGADTAFRKGAEFEEIYYPSDCTEESIALARKYHGSWDSVGMFGKRLHGRSPLQVLGRDLKTPSEVVICWTPDGIIKHIDRSIKTGGTGTAISIADAYEIQVFNIKREDHLEKILRWLN